MLHGYMKYMTGISESQLTRHIVKQLLTCEIKASWVRRNKFSVIYTKVDIEPLAEVQRTNEQSTSFYNPQLCTVS